MQGAMSGFLSLMDCESTSAENLSADEMKRLLSKLVDHLDDHFVKVESHHFDQSGPCHLCVFSARDQEKTPLYLMVNSQGDVFLGLVDALGKTKHMALFGFDPLWHQIVSVTVSDKMVYAGSTLEVWIIVDRFAKPSRMASKEEAESVQRGKETVLYHGRVGYNTDKGLHLGPAVDNMMGGHSNRWDAHLVDHFPESHLRWNWMCDPKVNPFHPIPEPSWETLTKMGETLAIDHVVRTLHATLIADRDQLRLLPDRAEGTVQHLPSLIRSVTLLEHRDRDFLGVAGCDDRNLVGFTLIDGVFNRRVFFQGCKYVPVALRFIPGPAQDQTQPDLLVVFNDGSVVRLRHVGRDQLKATWQSCWQRYVAEIGQTIQELNKHQIGQASDDQWQKALLVARIQKLIDELKSTDPGRWPESKKDILELFDSSRAEIVILAGMGALLNRVAWHYQQNELAFFASPNQEAQFLMDLIYQIYSKVIRFNMQEMVDSLFRSLERETKLAVNFKTLKELIKNSLKNRFVIYESLKGDIGSDKFFKNPSNPSETEWGRLADLCRLGYTQWADAYWQHDRLRLGQLRRRAMVNMVGVWRLIDKKKEHWLVVAQRERLIAYPLGEDLKIEGNKHCGYNFLGQHRDNIQNIAKVDHHGGTRLLVAGVSGKLYLLSPDSQKVDPGVDCSTVFPFKFVHELASPAEGSALALAVLMRSTAVPLFAAAYAVGPQTKLVVGQIENDTIEHHPPQAFELSRVRFLDLAAHGAGILMIKGASRGAPARLCWLGGSGKMEKRGWLHAIRAGTSAVCLNDKMDPKYALVTEQNGFIWCSTVNQAESPLIDTIWSYRLKGGIRGVLPLKYGEDSCFLVGSEAGEMVLLRAEDGRRLWKHKFPASIHHLVDITGDGSHIGIVLKGGWFSIYTRTMNAVDAMADIKTTFFPLLKACPPQTLQKVWKNRDRATVQAMYALEVEQQSYDAVIKHQPAPAKTRVLKHLAEVCPANDLNALSSVVVHITIREATHLMSYLPGEKAHWIPMIWRHVEQIKPTDEDGPNSKRALMVAAATWLQYMGRAKVDLQRLFTLTIPPSCWEHDWVCAEYSRILLEAALRIPGVDPVKNPGSLLCALLPGIFQIPDRILTSLIDALAYDDSVQVQFSVFQTVIKAIKRYEPKQSGDLPDIDMDTMDQMALILAPLKTEKSLRGILAHLFDLFQHYALSHQDPWAKPRQPALNKLRELHRLVFGIRDDDLSNAALIVFLRQVMQREPFPERRQPIEQQAQWINTFNHMVEGFDHIKKEDLGPWWETVLGIAKASREVFRGMIDKERKELANEVRPRLEVASVRRSPDGLLTFEFLCRPDGPACRHGVTLTFAAAGRKGLKPPGQQTVTKLLAEYPGPYPLFSFELSGFAQTDQEELSLMATLEADDGPPSRESWTFPIHIEKQALVGVNTLPKQLSAAYAKTLESAARVRTPVCFFIFDETLGANQVVRDWRDKDIGRVLDLFELFDDTGQGRIYDSGGLDASRIDEKIAGALDAMGVIPGQKPILFSNAGYFFRRLLVGERPGALDTWLKRLKHRSMQADQRPWLFLMASETAADLRCKGFGIKEIAVHREALSLLGGWWEAGDILKEGAEYEEMNEAGGRDRLMHQQLLALIQSKRLEQERRVINELYHLGWDPRLVIPYLDWIPTKGHEPSTPTAYLHTTEVRALLKKELISVSAIELIALMYGARCRSYARRSEVRPGMIAGADLFSTIRRGFNRPKLIQAEGQPFTTHSLMSLDSDSNPRHQLVVEGFGVMVTDLEVSKGLASLLPAGGMLKRLLKGLTELGMGEVINGVFRTRPPYREALSQLYADHKHLELADRDIAVYRALLGPERFPLESLPLEKVTDYTLEDLAGLFQNRARQDDLKRLQTLGRLWRTEVETPAANDDGVHRALTTVLEPLKPRPVTREITEGLLLSLGHPVFVLAGEQNEDVAYLVYLDHGKTISYPAAHDLIKQVNEPCEGNDQKRLLPLWILGPGAETLPMDKGRQCLILKPVDILFATWQGDLCAGLRRHARRQMKLTARSPFQTRGALPPGSRSFVGRNDELNYIKGQVQKGSILIVGSRRVGKTSLLNQVYFWARQKKKFFPVFLDLAGMNTEEEFNATLNRVVRDLGISVQKDADFVDVVNQIKAKEGKVILFLLNEIDGIAQNSRGLLERLRGLNDQHIARFVMVGYAALAEISLVTSPFFHWTTGTTYDNKALPLYELTEEAATSLLDLLSSPEMGLTWVDQEQRERAYKLCMERSYRIPWVLQQYCQLFLEELEQRREDVLSFDLVKGVLDKQGEVVWQYIDNLQFVELKSNFTDKGRQIAFKFILFSLARYQYFRTDGGAPIHNPELDRMNPLGPALSFQVVDVHEAVGHTMREILFKQEFEAIKSWFEKLDLDTVLRLLTLTLVLAPDLEHNGRYGFLLHILPKELHRRYKDKDPMLDNLILDLAVALLKCFDSKSYYSVESVGQWMEDNS